MLDNRIKPSSCTLRHDRVDNRRAALLVDSLIGQQQLVVKSLETNLHAVAGIAGATILGDGRVALILDVNSIVRTNAARARSAA